MTYKILYNIPTQCERLLVGLRKIDEATEQLIVLNELLKQQEIVVAEKILAGEMIEREISEGK